MFESQRSRRANSEKAGSRRWSCQCLGTAAPRGLKSFQNLIVLLAALTIATDAWPQTTSFQYFFDDISRLTKVIDSAGNEIDYSYDAVGNQTQIKRSAAPAAGTLSILNFTPQMGPSGAMV